MLEKDWGIFEHGESSNMVRQHGFLGLAAASH